MRGLARLTATGEGWFRASHPTPRIDAFPFVQGGRSVSRCDGGDPEVACFRPVTRRSPEANHSGMTKRALGVLAWLLFMGGLVEAASRTFWLIRFSIPFAGTRWGGTAFYPQLAGVLSAKPSRRDSIIDVLLLGGSTLHPDYGSVAQALREKLMQNTGRPVRIFNLGWPAHTSLDSYYQYRALSGVAFDVVVQYDGFNEVRANNVPPAMFRDDYSHFFYYELARDVVDRHRLSPLATPYTLRHIVRSIGSKLAERAGRPWHIPLHRPDSTWTAYGKDIRTREPFRRNVTTVLDSAAARGDPFVLVTLATHVAPGYSREAFRAKRLDYSTHRFPIEFWGRPEHVVAGVATHNALLRELHGARANVGFVDMEHLVPREGRYFNDICHFTTEGSQRFAAELVPEIVRVLSPALARPQVPGEAAMQRHR